ncbi:hypothetical protein [Arthrobacter sp. UYCu511]|uniref:hypothetical protein n=1 Tax=Arthrobacter sp. UYCu511 TaxID=3156337 RepID=UPI003399695F
MAFAPNDRVVPAKISADLPIRLASLDADGDVRPIRKRQRSTPHPQLLYSTNLLLRGYDTAVPSMDAKISPEVFLRIQAMARLIPGLVTGYISQPILAPVVVPR